MPDRPTLYVTTPIYYVNDAPHLGHCYTTLLADAMARFGRLDGRDVFFLTGTDEHAEKVTEAAAVRGITPQEWADENARAFADAFAAMGISNDDFIRTSEERHKSRVSGYIAELRGAGDVYLGEYEGWWDASQEEYVTEKVARQHDHASPVTGRPLERRVEQNYFFRLSRYGERLRRHLEENPGFVRPPARRNEVLGRIDEGLQDVPISRAVDPGDPSSSWGVLMPGDDSHRIYVWIDALANYLSTVDVDGRRHYWPADFHLIAKDILWFHAVIWPAMLMALGRDLPGSVYTHSYWIREGRKMSKSLGNFLDVPQLLGYVDAFGLDAVRWFLLTQGPHGAHDADFAHARFIEIYNADLANGIGNAGSRVAAMIGKYFDGRLPDPGGDGFPGDVDWPRIAGEAVDRARRAMGEGDVARALDTGIALSRRVDAYIGETEPFKLAKDPARRDELSAILYASAEALRLAALLMAPAMPERMGELSRRLGLAGEPSLARHGEWGVLVPGAATEKGPPLFQRAEPDADEPPPRELETRRAG